MCGYNKSTNYTLKLQEIHVIHVIYVQLRTKDMLKLHSNSLNMYTISQEQLHVENMYSHGL
jgi:hypothetical protein